MKIAEIMTADVVSVRPYTPFKEVVEQLVRSNISGVPVVTDDGQLVGIVTEADLTSKEAYSGHRRRTLALLADVLAARPHHWVSKAAGWAAANVMTKNVIVCDAEDDVRVVARQMLERPVKRMPVLRDGQLAGIVSQHDILKIFVRPDEAIAADVERRLATDWARPDDCHIHPSVANGVTTLTGDVRDSWDEQKAITLARDVFGVVAVVSELHNRALERSTTPKGACRTPQSAA